MVHIGPRVKVRLSPMMPYWLRVTIGVILGVTGAVLMWLVVGKTWMTATVGAILAPLGFLLTYFIWSADRPADGYEQVLFDRPNTIVSVVLLATLGLAGVGTGFLGHASGPPSVADQTAALYAHYQSASDAYSKKSADGAATTAKVAQLRTEAATLATAIDAMPDSNAKTALKAAAASLTSAMDSLDACIGGSNGKCVDARLAAADAQSAITRATA